MIDQRGFGTVLMLGLLAVVLIVLGLGYRYRQTQKPSPPSREDESLNERTGDEQIPPANNVAKASIAAGQHEFSIRDNGITRKYFVYVPSSYKSPTPTPLVLNFHGGGGGGQGHMETSKMNPVAETGGFIAVYPNGTRRDGDTVKPLQRFWNPLSGPRGPYYATNDPIANVDDIDFVNKLLDELEKKFNVDRRRIFAAGFSNGGALTHLLACRLSNRIAAITSVAGPFWNNPADCAVERPVAVMTFHGTADVCAPYQGGVSQCSAAKAIDRDFISAAATTEVWRSINRCPAVSQITYQKGKATCQTYGPCANGTEVTLCTITDGGHTWPGGQAYSLPGLNIGETSYDINASAALWDFFVKHPLSLTQ